MKKLLVLLLALLLLAGCGKKGDDKTITVAASPTPHAEILEFAKDLLAKEGWTLEVKEFEDYVQPVNVVEEGDIDANYFAHTPYLNNFNAEKGTHQVVVAEVHYEPYGLYPGAKKTIDELADGDEILVPNDGTNETRALLLLQDNGIITLPEGTNATSLVTALDVKPGKVDVKIVEVEAAQISRSRQDAAMVVLNGNYALAAGLSVSKDAVAYESATSSAATTYVNVLAVKDGSQDKPGIQALVKVLESKEVADFISSKWADKSVVPFNK